MTSASDEKWWSFNCFFSQVGLRTFQNPCKSHGLQSFCYSVYRNLKQFAFSAQNTATCCDVSCATFRTQCVCVSKCVTVEFTVFNSEALTSVLLRRVVASPYQDPISFATEACSHVVPSVTTISLYKETQGKTTTTTTDQQQHQHQQRYGFHPLVYHVSWSMIWPPATFSEVQWAFCSGCRIHLMLLCLLLLVRCYCNLSAHSLLRLPGLWHF